MLSNDALVEALNSQSQDPASAGGYSVVAVHAWTHTVTDVHYVMSRLNEGVQLVTADKFIERYVANVVH
jgi:hypothetical protein